MIVLHAKLIATIVKHLTEISVEIPEGLYLKNPNSSNLGKRIVSNAIHFIYNFGFEDFNFKKLAVHIDSTESSIYRYFENKNKLLLYLSSLYWGTMEYQLLIKTSSISDRIEVLNVAVEVLSESPQNTDDKKGINHYQLQQIIIADFNKPFHSKLINATEEQEAYFQLYTRFIQRLAEIIQFVSPNYEYPLSLASTLAEGLHYQIYLSKHFKEITDCKTKDSLQDFFIHTLDKTLNLQLNGRKL